MTFIGTETGAPVNQSQTGSGDVAHASPLQPLELASVRRPFVTSLSLNVRERLTKAPSHSFILIFIPPSTPHIPTISSLFYEGLTPSAPPPTTSFSTPQSRRSQSAAGDVKEALQAIRGDLISTALQGKSVLTNFTTILP